MQNLGFTRSSYQRDHLLLTPDTFVRAPLPGMTKCTAIVHAAPAVGARFTEYTAEFEAGGRLGECGVQRFVYVVEGELNIGGPGCYAYEPAEVSAVDAAKAVVIEKEYVPAQAGRPAPLTGREADVKARPFGDAEVKVLIPEDAAFDFAVNTMTFQPGAALPMVEIHVMEHGGRRDLPAGREVVSGDGGRLHLDGAVLPAVVRRAGEDAGEIPYL
jgi:(S)-ureidoglycine aminohydrolase